MKFFNKVKNIFFNSKYFIKNNGYCFCCNSDVVFSSNSKWLRDFYICNNCGSIPRERVLLSVIEKYYPQWRSLNIHESSPSPRGASLKLKNECPKYVASHYYQDDNGNAKEREYINIDLENQKLKNESFDLVITQDVMEHIFNPEKAFKEIARTLKSNGAHIFTVPLINKNKKTEKWAIKKGPKVKFLKTPEYHGNPIDDKGSPVTYHWGYDIAEFIYLSSGLVSTIIYIDNIDLGIRAEYIEVIVSRKI